MAVAGLTISGAQASDYTLTEPTATANITPAALSITAVTNTKSYDGTTSAAGIPIYQVANEPVNTLYGSDRLTNLTETYDNPNAGTGKTLSVLTDTISDANNYAVTLVANKTGVITAASATATFVKTDTKTEGNWIGTYDSRATTSSADRQATRAMQRSLPRANRAIPGRRRQLSPRLLRSPTAPIAWPLFGTRTTVSRST